MRAACSPAGKLRQLSVLENAVADMLAAVGWMRAKYPAAADNILLAGFSFGGPVCWAGECPAPSDLDR